jgi:energy-coupling factor transporter ATP-binding protein EcfA2
MARRIESVALRGFRGASTQLEIAFDPTAPITLIFGENGAGKSTICDAIDFICNGRFGSLQDKSASMKAHESVVSLGASARDLDVELRYGGLTWNGKLKGTKPLINGPESRPVAHVLRRVDISKVVEAAPRDKYEALKGFIASPGIEKSEKTLRDAVRSAKNEIDDAARAKDQADAALKQLWELEGSPSTDPLTWAHDVISQDVSAVQQRVADAQRRQTAATRAASVAQQVDDARGAERRAAKALASLNAQLDDAQANSRGRDASMLKLLREADAFLRGAAEAAPLDTCPICGQSSTRAHLQAHIAAQMAEMTALIQLQERVDAAQRDHAAALSAMRTAESAYTPKLSAARMSDDALALLAGQLAADQKLLGQRNAVKSHVDTILRLETPIVESAQRLDRLEKMLQIVEAGRKAHVDAVLGRISATVDALYARIHPNESLGAVKVYLKEGSVGSLELDGRFETHDGVPPASYYSEAHLDTLGLCVYLALARHNGQDSIIVLDDVLTSIDDAHLGRVIDLLHDEAKHFNQVIITTHFRTWRDKYRFHQAPGGRVQLIQLQRWSLERGVRTSKDVLSSDELREWLDREPFDRQVVASKAGVLCESLLDRLTELYRCKLPRKPDNAYTLVELARGIDAKLKQQLHIARSERKTPLEPLINAVDSYAFVRNQVGAHHNAAGAQIPDDDVRAFAGVALALSDALVCEICGQMPTRAKSATEFACQCGATIMSA